MKRRIDGFAALILMIEFLLLILCSAIIGRSANSPIPLRAHGIRIGTAVDPLFLQEPIYAGTLAREFGMVEAENSMKWASIHPAKDVYDFREGDALVRFAEEHKMAVRGHCLLWRVFLPKWLGSAELQRKMDQVLRDHIHTVVGHYRRRVFAWDVVNEAFSADGSLSHSHWYDRPGIGVGPGTAYIEKAFTWAREADRSAKLFYNDFEAEELNAKSDAIYAMVKDFKRRGVPIDGIGFQAHATLAGINKESFKANMARFAALGVEIHITELDVSIPKHAIFGYARQARVYKAIVAACLETPACSAIQTWGFTDAHSWIPENTHGLFGDALLFDQDYTPKPAYFAVNEILAENVRIRNSE